MVTHDKERPETKLASEKTKYIFYGHWGKWDAEQLLNRHTVTLVATVLIHFK